MEGEPRRNGGGCKQSKKARVNEEEKKKGQPNFRDGTEKEKHAKKHCTRIDYCPFFDGDEYRVPV